MKKNFNQGLALFMILFTAVSALAGDRVIEVQTRLNSALSGMLSRADYLVIVNRLDALDVSSGQAASGAVRNLPGLRVGVDDEGQVVLKDDLSAAYSGPVSVTVVIDSQVKIETYRAIETLLPEIMGGARGGDEVKLKRAVLHQPELVKPPQVVINNQAPQIDPKMLSGTNDLYKIAAMFLLGLGALLWVMSRQQQQGNERSNSRSRSNQEPERIVNENRQNPGPVSNWNPQAFESYDPQILGLYILKCVRDGDVDRARSFFAAATSLAQRNALAAIPPWCAAYCLEHIEPKENDRGFRTVNPEAIMRELTVMEAALKNDPSAKSVAMIQWIPAGAMAKVHPESLAAPSDHTRYAIISLRPDLARTFKYDENDALVSGMVFNAKAIVEAGKEMQAWRTRLVLVQSAKTTVVDAMAGVVNRAETFEEVDAKLKGIQRKMSKIDWEALQAKIASKNTFDILSDLQKKDFLRLCDPIDYFFAVDHLSLISWPLDTLLRPKRLAGFRMSEQMRVHDEWTDEQKREANMRVLTHLRTAYLGEQTGVIETQAA